MKEISINHVFNIILLLLVVTSFLPTLFYSFVWDDFFLTTTLNSGSILEQIGQSFSSGYMVAGHSDVPAQYFRPVVSLFFILENTLYGNNPFGYHLTNVLLHLLVVFMLKKLIFNWTGDAKKSFITAALFSVFPLHVESVAWISGRTDIICTAFILLVLLSYHSTHSLRGKRLLLKYILVLFLFALAVLSKETGFILIVMVPLVDLLVYDKLAKDRARILFYLSFVLVGVALLLLRSGVLDVEYHWFYPNISTWTISFFATFGRYILRMVYPFSPDPYIENPYISSIFDLKFLVGLVFLGMFIIGFLHFKKKKPLLSYAFVLVGLGLFPVMNPCRIGSPVDMGFTMADRYTYFPSIGIAIMAAWFILIQLRQAAINVRDKKTRDGGSLIGHPYVAVAIILTLFIGLTLLYEPRWSNEETLYQSTLEYHPNAGIMHANLAYHYYKAGKFKNALSHIEDFERISGDLDEGLVNIKALTLFQMGRPADTIDHLVRAFKKNPNSLALLTNLGTVYLRLGSPEQAKPYFEAAVKLSSDYSPALAGLAESLRNMGQLSTAREIYEKILAREQNNAEVWVNYGALLFETGDFERGENSIKRGISLSPQKAAYFYSLASNLVLYADRGDEALEAARHAMRLDSELKEVYPLLAEIYLQREEFSRARRWAEAGLKRVEQDDEMELLLRRKIREIQKEIGTSETEK